MNTCNAAFAGHDPASEVATYVLLTISGRRAITACRGCADAALAMGMAIRGDERREPRASNAPAMQRLLAHRAGQ